MQIFDGTLSRREGESIHETGVDLIALNEICELPKNEQFVFLQRGYLAMNHQIAHQRLVFAFPFARLF